MIRGTGGPRQPGKGGSSGARAVATARPARSGDESWGVPQGLQDAKPEAWKVKPDAARPAEGLQSTIAAPLPGSVLFGAPESGVAANVYANRNEGGPAQWARLDLRKPAEAKPINIRPDKTPAYLSACALSPSGEQLVLATEPNDVNATHLTFFTYDGKIAQTLRHQRDPGKLPPTWLMFATEDILLMWRDGRLIGFDRKKDAEIFSRPAPFMGPPALSPGRKWLVGFTGKGFEFYCTTDGAPAGGLGIPDGWFEGTVGTGLSSKSEAGLAAETSTIVMSFSPDGQRLATCVVGPKGASLVVVWDLARGAAAESFVMPFRDTQTRLPGPWVWCSARQLLTRNGVLIDLDLKTFVIVYEVYAGLALVGNPLDGRFWQIGGVPRDKFAEARAKAGVKNQQREYYFLTATTMPVQQERAALAAAKSGFLFLPGTPVSVESVGAGPQAHHDQLVDLVADELAAKGTPIDPEAKVIVRIEQSPIRTEQIRGAMIKVLRPNYGVFKVVDALVTGATVNAVSVQGQQLFALTGYTPEQAVAQADPAAEDYLYQRVRTGIRTCRLPRLVARSRQGQPIVLGQDNAAVATTAVPIGVDGLFEVSQRPKQ
jgi:hypothetical protein